MILLAERHEQLQQRCTAQDFYGLKLENGFFEATPKFLSEVPHRNESVAAQLSDDIFSRMIYRNICPGQGLPRPQRSSVLHANTLLRGLRLLDPV